MLFSCVATSVLLCGSETAVSAFCAISNREYVEPSVCSHCLPEACWYASARSLAVSPVSEDLYGMYGPHHESVAMLLTRSPRASVSAGKSSTFATVASLGLYPCCAACFHMVLKSGGIGALMKMSHFSLLNFEIIAV